MADRPSVLQIAQIGVEVTEGTAVGCSRRLRTLMFSLTPQAEVDEMRASGNKWMTLTALNREWTEAAITGEPDYNEIIYLLGSVLNAGSVAFLGTAVSSQGTITRWMYEPNSTTLDTFKSYTVEHGDSNHAMRFANGMVTEIKLNVSRQNVDLTAQMIGTRMAAVTLGGTALYITHDSQRPIIPGHWDIYLDDTSANLGTTKLTRDFVANWSVGARHIPIWPINSANASFAATTEGPIDAGLTLQVGADATGTALYNTLRNGATKFCRMVATGGTTPGGSFNYSLQIDQALQVISAPSPQDVDSLYVWEWQFRTIYDTGWGKALRVEVVNTLPVYP